jgi:uncharacterized protein
VRKTLEDGLAHLLGRYVENVQRRARAVILVEIAVTIACAALAASQLGVNMDNKKLLSPDLPFQQAARSYGRYFPSLDDALLVVVDAQTAEQARDAAQALATRLSEDRERFRDVYVPGGDPFFQRYGLLYRSPDELDDFVDHMALIQPVLAQLTMDPSIARLADLIRVALEQERKNPGSTSQNWPAVLDRIGDATVRVFDEYPVSISWESMIVDGTALDPGTRQVVVAEPVLEFGKLLAAQSAIAEIRQTARALDLTAERGIDLRITGNPALNYEEMLGLAWDIGVSSCFSFLLVTAVLYLALRNMRLVVAAAVTLLVGLVWTAGFATLAVGQLNVLSIAFAVLFIGLGVDFAIHLGMHHAEALQRGATPRDAMRFAMSEISTALVLCSFTTAIGFLAFVPTSYLGIAELGLIAGGGMFIIVFQTFTLFPALLVPLLEGRSQVARPSLPLRLSPPRIVATHPGTIAVLALLIGGLAAVQLPKLRFDIDVVAIRDQDTESVQAFRDLLARSRTSPWYIDALAPNLEAAQRLAERMRQLDEVRVALSLADYVPVDQEEKREILDTVSMLLEVPGDAVPPAAPPVDEQVEALGKLRTELGAEWLRREDSPLGRSARDLARHLDRFLERVEREGNATAALAELQDILLGNFETQLDRLRRAVEPPPLTRADLPAALERRMLAPDGHARVQIFPREDLSDNAEVTAFVDAVRAIEPQATGVAVNLLEFGRATSDSLRQALTMAFAAITVLLLGLWRRLMDTALVLAPLLLGATLTGGLMVAIDMPFNFVNVVVLPLLIGIGVDSGIHLVHTAHGGGSADNLLDSVTARAVLFSALTTIASFGSLSFSSHKGIAGMGVLLVCGMLIVLTCNLVVLPALLTLRARASTGERDPLSP